MNFLFTLLLLGSLAAPGGRIAILDKVPGHRVSFDYSYALSKDGKPAETVTGGKVTVEGNCFIMTGLDLEVRSDGATRWTIDPGAKEVVIENIDKEDLFTNPALFINSYPQYRDRLTVHSEGQDSLDITLTLDENTSCRFRLSGVRFSDPLGTGDIPPSPFDSSWIVTDLR